MREATEALNQASFGLPGLTERQAAEVTSVLCALRIASGDTAAGDTAAGAQLAAATSDPDPAGPAGAPDGRRP